MPACLTFEFWQNVADYGNYNWNGHFSDREIRENAELYFEDWKYSIKQKELSDTIRTLIRNLTEDVEENVDEAKEFLIEIYRECDKNCINHD